MNDARSFFDALNRQYVAVHKTKEDLFWSTYMGLSEDDAAFARAESAFKDFVSDPSSLAETRAHIAHLETCRADAERDGLLRGLKGWEALFAAHVIENEEGRRLMHDIIDAEAALFAKRRAFAPRHVNERGEEEDATLGMAATNLSTNPVEAYRRSSFDALRTLERWVLDNGFLELVTLRNRLARALGYRDFFDMKLRKNERMTPAQLTSILDDFVLRTESAHARSLADLRARHGGEADKPWNLRFLTSGDVLRQMDEYLPFASALRRWIESFRRLQIEFRGATLQLDLLDRAGKHQNGFCHSPVPAWMNERGEWIPGHINFTSDGKPDQVGSGVRAITTLFHEGGHAAHFANVVQNAPCFSQEYAPTSMAYAETQSMFCDSLLDDGDWLKRYARNRHGDAIPDSLIHDRVASRQPMRAFEARSIAVVPYFESALYAMNVAELTPDAVLELARATERRVLGMESPRPLVGIPHLLNQESAASYQGYLLAEMAVHQTRAFFLRRDGYLTDNAAIGPALSAHYWRPGNSVDHDSTLRSLTGEGFSAQYLADDCNQSVEEAWAVEQESILAAADRKNDGREATHTLDAGIRIVHGTELLADSTAGEEAMCAEFERWVAAHYPDVSGAE
jgi:oligoendopeptidase F